MRVISGRLKGRSLVDFDAAHIRPTTDRMKETMFNICDWDFEGISVLDLFAGTGNLGIEAASRGASSVCFVEKSVESVSILKQNLAKFQKDLAATIEIAQIEVQGFLEQHKSQFDVILIDPPFTEKLADSVMSLLATSAIFHDQTTVLIESGQSEQLKTSYRPFQLQKQKVFGDKTLSMFSVEV